MPDPHVKSAQQVAAPAMGRLNSWIPAIRDRVKSEQFRPYLLVIILVAALAFPYLDRNEGDIDAAANALAFAMLALGLNIVVGFAGLLDLGYAAFFAIGAYTYGALSSYQIQPQWSSFWEPFQWLGLVQHLAADGGAGTVHFDVSFWLMLPLAALVAAFFGVLFGAPTLRLKGDYLAIVTLGFGEIVPIVARNTPSITNGAQGLSGVSTPRLFGYNFGVMSTPYYYLGLVLIVLLIFISARLKHSRVGRAWLAIREDEIAAEAMGVNRTRLKLLAFAIGAGFAGLTGTFYVAKLQTATPEMFMFPVSVMILVMIVLGGIGSVAGVVVGALILQLLQSWFLQDLTQWIHTLGEWTGIAFLERVDLVQSIELIFGIILVVMMLYRRQGLIPERAAVKALTYEQQSAMPSRNSVDARLVPLHRRTIDPGEPLLEITGLAKFFGGIKAVNRVDLSVMPGSIVAIIGPNGSGKTTFFNLITGLIEPDGGKVLLAGKNVTGLKPHRIVEKGIARTFQNLRLFANMTVLENALVGAHARTATGAVGAVLRLPRVKREEAAARARALDILGIFGNRLMPRLQHLAFSLSYANRRRLEIARALVSEPVLLLLDEPTAGMNPTETLELTHQIRHLRERGVTILLIEHKLDVVNEIADKVIVLDHGEKIAEGTPKQVHSNKEVLRAYLGRTTDAVAAAAAAS
ncbi:branched-chain amino acid ABC transporter ATP-binding protein/permease [Bradyrhizobium sp.]|uniref:branched-chain amino acid ABC transporter ATP-binding protein/permease n=1 Tax=Bradyrhizobium sp. TaxID=376 RepID=UPI002BAEDA96|nr:branched-chain amino acid ABC transporter ATP-binding protein/permease [Bradyrhizobium sp.]HWX61005.1 branched-chain amino acid ABC transporter ATP-binding protein/permease [Bradyrhizobium sp.]